MAVGNLATPGTELPAGNAGAENDIAIRVQNLSKCYQLYDRPEDRLKQAIYPRLQKRCVGMPAKQYFRGFWCSKTCRLKLENLRRTPRPPQAAEIRPWGFSHFYSIKTGAPDVT